MDPPAMPHQKKRWERWLEKQDPFTQSELEKRDKRLRQVSVWLYRHGATANRITALGFILTGAWFFLYSFVKIDYFLFHFAFVALIGLTDILDGPVARNNDDVTLRGILGDHFRDLGALLITGWIALAHGFPRPLFAIFLAIEAGVHYLKWYALRRQLKEPLTREKFFDFAEENFQHTVSDRYYCILYFSALFFFGLGQEYASDIFREVGLVLIGGSVAFGGITLVKEYGWEPIETQEKNEPQ